MRFFPVYDLQMVVLLTFLGLVALVLLYVGFGSSYFSKLSSGKDGTQEDYPAGIRAKSRPVPPLLIFLYVAFVIWAVIYVIVIGIRGRPF